MGALTCALAYRHITTGLFAFLGVKTTTDIFASATDPASSPLYSPQGLEVVTNLALAFFVMIFVIAVLYSPLPWGLIPNWIPFFGKMDDLIISGFGALAAILIAVTCHIQFNYTEQSHTHTFVDWGQLMLRYVTEFTGLSTRQKIHVVEHWVGDAFNWIVNTFHI